MKMMKMLAEEIDALVEAIIKDETGATVEVTICNGEIRVYTEDLTKIEAIKNLVGQTRDFLRISEYEADEDFPAGATLTFAL